MTPSTADQNSKDRILFIDDAQIQSLAGVQRRIHPGARFEGNPLLRGGRAWESDSLMLGTVLKEDGGYRMWYGSGVGERGYAKGRLWHLYAESADGIEWRLPSLRQFTDPAGSADNNVFLDPQSGAHQYSNVMRTPELGPGRRYTLLAYSVDGHYVRFSDDGLVWTEWSAEPVIPRFGDVGFYLYDRAREAVSRDDQALPAGSGQATPHPELDYECRRLRMDAAHSSRDSRPDRRPVDRRRSGPFRRDLRHSDIQVWPPAAWLHGRFAHDQRHRARWA